MALSPADFYSYSRATGAPIPEDPEERARMAPEVLEYRRNQLRAPRQEQQQGPDPLSVGLGIGIALAGGVGGAYGFNKLLRGSKRSANAGVRQTDLGSFVEEAGSTVRRTQEQGVPTVVPKQSEPQPSKQPVVSTQPVETDPWSSAGITEARTKPAPWSVVDQPPTESQPKLLAPDFASKYIDELGEELELKRQARAVQQVEAQEKAQAKNILAEMRREEEAKKFTPRSYIEDTGAVAPPEDLTSKQQQELPEVIDQKINAVESGEDQVTGRVLRRAQIDTDFVKFSQQATDVSNRWNHLRDIAYQVNQFDEQLENLGLQNKQYQGSVNQPRKYTAEDLTGMFRAPSGREIMVHQGGRRIGMTNAEIRDRVMAAASATPDQEQLLLNPDIPTTQVRHLLGTTGRSSEALEEAFTNPTFEVRGSAATSPQTELAQEFLEEQMGTGALGFAATRRMMNPEYSARLSKFKDEWDKLSEQGMIAPRRTLIGADEYTYQQMKELVEQGDSPIDKELYDRSGIVLRDLAQSIGLSDVPETIVTLSQGPILREVRTTRERTATGASPIVAGVEKVSSTLEGSERQERTTESAMPLRMTRGGEESTGVYATKETDLNLIKQLKQAENILATPNEWEEKDVIWAKNLIANKEQIENLINKEQVPFRMVPTKVESTGLVGGYQTNTQIPVFDFYSVQIGSRGQMVPMQRVQGTYGGYLNPVGRIQQLSDAKPTRFYSGASETLDVQPFMVTNLVTQTVGGGKGAGAVQKQFVVNQPVYGQLLARTSEGKLVPTTLNREKVTGKARQLSEQFANKDPLERGGLIADALHQDLLANSNVDLPVLKDPAAGRQFVNDLLNIESDVQQYGRPATGRVTTRSKDLLNNQKFAAEYIEGRGYAESVPLTTRRTYGLGSVNPMETEGGEFAAYTPRIENVMTAKMEEARRRRGIVR